MMRRVVTIGICVFLVPVFVRSQQRTEIDALVSQMFLGQAYPSGNAYLKPFVGDGLDASTWPSQIALTPIAQNLPRRSARFSRVLRSAIEDNTIKSLYIPGEEGVDDDHDFCGLGEIKKRDPSYQLISPDFFEAIVDHCEPNDGIGVYRTTPSTYSVMVFGAAQSIPLKRRQIPDGGPRPLTSAERRQVETARQSQRGAADCTTVPGYLDQAVVLMEADLSSANVSLRLSSYVNPGCAGHLTNIYVLDILQGGAPVRTLEIFQYGGNL